MRSALLIVAGLCAGLLIGWFVFSTPPASTDCPAIADTNRAAAPTAPALGDETAAARREARPRSAIVEAKATLPAAERAVPVECQPLTAELRGRVAQVETELQEANDKLGRLGGKALPWPDNLDGRHDQRALLTPTPRCCARRA